MKQNSKAKRNTGGRPQKTNCDYFPHMANLRNDRIIKSVRSQFGIEGYGIYLMLLETLTEASYTKIVYNEKERQLLAGDFGCSADKLDKIILHLQEFELVTIENDTLYSKWLNEKLEPVFEKRNFYREIKQKQVFHEENIGFTDGKDNNKIKQNDIKPFFPSKEKNNSHQTENFLQVVNGNR